MGDRGSWKICLEIQIALYHPGLCMLVMMAMPWRAGMSLIGSYDFPNSRLRRQKLRGLDWRDFDRERKSSERIE
jgi:uncharacterized protein YhjY with autotransporter beta-barrel domain